MFRRSDARVVRARSQGGGEEGCTTTALMTRSWEERSEDLYTLRLAQEPHLRASRVDRRVSSVPSAFRRVSFLRSPSFRRIPVPSFQTRSLTQFHSLPQTALKPLSGRKLPRSRLNSVQPRSSASTRWHTTTSRARSLPSGSETSWSGESHPDLTLVLHGRVC